MNEEVRHGLTGRDSRWADPDEKVIFEPMVFTWDLTKNIHGRRCLCLMWRQPTQFWDIRYIRFVTFHWLAPWLTNVGGIVHEDSSNQQLRAAI